MFENEHVRITVEVHSESGTEHCTAILELGYHVTDARQGNAYLELLAGKHKAQYTGQQITARIQQDEQIEIIDTAHHKEHKHREQYL